MSEPQNNLLITGLIKALGGDPLAEKFLIAPNRRIGFQWLDRATRAGAVAANVKVTTVSALALDLASPQMAARKLSLASSLQKIAILTRAFSRIQEKHLLHLTRLDPNPELIEGIMRTLDDLRRAGFTAQTFQPTSLGKSDKARELSAFLAEYEREMELASLIDYAGALSLALAASRGQWDAGQKLIISRGEAGLLKGLEKELWDALPAEAKLELDADPPALLPPAPTEVQVFRAAGEANEAREVLRRVLELGVPLDEVEVIHTDGEIYPPLFHEIGLTLAGTADDPPFTFSEGLPLRYSRPGRALLGLCAWLGDDFRQKTLTAMIKDRLLRVAADGVKISAARLAAVLRSARIGQGRERWLPALENEIAASRSEIKSGKNPENKRKAGEREQGLRVLLPLVSDLFRLFPEGAGQKTLIQGALEFLGRYCPAAGRFDEYSLHSLSASLREMAEILSGGDLPGFDPVKWIEQIALSSAVGGQGPRPGAIFVAPLASGGHSGRCVTFIVGLDDGRFPGGGAQDPILLDGERARLSANLATGEARAARRAEDFKRLVGGLRGKLFLSYSSRDVADDSAMFPSPLLFEVFRLLAPDREPSLEEMSKWAGVPASFAPAEPARALTASEWWMSVLTGERGTSEPEKAVGEAFENLARGFIAREKRDSTDFTEYDGLVPEAGRDHDPTRKDGPVLSASRLEKMARCPYEYFLQYVLEIEPPENYEIDPETWLDALRRGSLLHEVFYRFMSELKGRGEDPSFKRHEQLMAKIMDEEIEKETGLDPPPSPLVFEREIRCLRAAAAIFLKNEETHCLKVKPRWFEAALGMKQENGPCEIGAPDPVPVSLPGGKTIRCRGKLDRVDEVRDSDPPRFQIWDYKSGGSRHFTEDGPFKQGRNIQNCLYVALLEKRLKEVYPGALVESFGYLFPNHREHGLRVKWGREELEEGIGLVAALVNLMRSGAFPFTDNDRDLTFSEFLAAYGDLDLMVTRSKRKLLLGDSPFLEPMRTLRAPKKKGKAK